MDGFLAIAGLAEAAIFYGLLIIGGIVLVAAGLLALLWWKRSLVAIVIACILVLLAGFLLQPWSAFSLPTSDDPDETYCLLGSDLLQLWMLFVVASAACLARVLRYRRL